MPHQDAESEQDPTIKTSLGGDAEAALVGVAVPPEPRQGRDTRGGEERDCREQQADLSGGGHVRHGGSRSIPGAARKASAAALRGRLGLERPWPDRWPSREKQPGGAR